MHFLHMIHMINSAGRKHLYAAKETKIRMQRYIDLYIDAEMEFHVTISWREKLDQKRHFHPLNDAQQRSLLRT